MKAIAEWLEEILPKIIIPFGEHNMRLQKSKGVPRDLKEAINCVLLQSELDAKSLSFPLILDCMVRFCQTSRDRCTDDEGEGVFDID